MVDASVIVAALVDTGPDGAWAEPLLTSDRLCAPHLMPVEVANILRRAGLAGEISAEISSLAHAELLDLSIELYSYKPLASRAWELRANLTAYDAWYVSLAESIRAPLATLDGRLARAIGPTCEIITPPLK